MAQGPTSRASRAKGRARGGRNKKVHPRHPALALSGGSTGQEAYTPRRTILGSFAAAWGSLGVMYILASPIKRLLPVALQPFSATTAHPLAWWGWGLYAAWVGFMAYTEGFKAFQQKFSPMVVARAASLESGPTDLWWWPKALLAPFYSMGLFHATRKRLIVSWGMVFGIAGIVAACKRLPLPWRSVIDGGVVAGLTWGAVSVAAIYIRTAFTGKAPKTDPQLPL